MKRAGIITYHFAVNYGAILQCYALNRAINNLNIDCRVINYVSEKQQNNNSLYRRGKNNIIKNIVLIPFHKLRKQRAERIQQFSKEYLNLTYKVNSIEQLEDQVANEGFNYLISGSDQVWNPHIEDFEPAFFYPFESKAKKIGYAVSVGKAQEQDLMPYADWIRQFSNITVREESSEKLIGKLAGHDVSSIVDPVFLISKAEWTELINKSDYSAKADEQILVCYFVRTVQLDKKIEAAQSIADELHLKLVIISPRITKYNFTKTVVSNAGPLEFLLYFNLASYVCTDSFHGTVFSALLNKQFSTFERKEDKRDGRKIDILKKLHLENRIQYLDEALEIGNIIDYETINPLIDEIRADALENLRAMLD
ncbi:MAG: polysaccharide pyruvyl transferase family protein [Oscillospiraceae bacterium]|nr:polysaccharide pyruvyl transferase family protein [Oscillospiraceae bacterium]